MPNRWTLKTARVMDNDENITDVVLISLINTVTHTATTLQLLR